MMPFYLPSSERPVQWTPAESRPLGPACPSFEIVLPVRDEEQALERSVETILSHAKSWGERFESLVIVDNGSRDGTWAIAGRLCRRDARVRRSRVAGAGRGRALRQAWSESRAEVSLYMDVDLSTSLEHVAEALHWMEQGYDVVAGSRSHPGARVERSKYRRALAWSYAKLLEIFFSPCAFRDAQCGFKAVRLSAVRALLPLTRSASWFFDTELLVLGERLGLRIRSLPVVWREAPRSRVRPFRNALSTLAELVSLRVALSKLCAAS
jgi:glycosyltransferase involved in cell wall biosynthesis